MQVRMQHKESPTAIRATGHELVQAIRGHLPALDGVRGLAIAMVMAFHFLTPTGDAGPIESGIGKVVGYGVLGVDLFFVLSGFLITGILYDSCNSPGYFRNFYMRRSLRIFPIYYGVLVAVFLVIPFVPTLNCVFRPSRATVPVQAGGRSDPCRAGVKR
jgi:peptidoglycan/LPS O-acetylase OafA/YrhL